MVSFEGEEHFGEPGPERVQFCFIAGAHGAATAPHEGIEVGGKGHFPEPGVAGIVQEVVVVKVAVGHGHRFAPVGAHGLQRCGVVPGREQADFPADQLGVGAGPRTLRRNSIGFLTAVTVWLPSIRTLLASAEW